MTTVTVRLADLRRPEELDATTPLFGAYRRFYGRTADPASERAFLAERAARGESVVFLAHNAAGTAVGFTQLYPSFSSNSMGRIFVLNDLYVAETARRLGAGRALLAAAAAHGREVGALRLGLSTAVDNLRAQALYESAGWKRDTVYFNYELSLR